MPKLKSFLAQLLNHKDKARKRELEQVFNFFLLPMAGDEARSALPDPDDRVLYGSLITSLAVAQEAIAREYGTVRALHDYMPEEEDGLAFSEGDIITLFGRPDAEWMEGGCGGRLGLFPANLVEVLEEVEATRLPFHFPSSTTDTSNCKPRGPLEELMSSEQKYVESLIAARDEFFPKLRHFISVHEALLMFTNWGDLIFVS
jgi:hypothetical protein